MPFVRLPSQVVFAGVGAIAIAGCLAITPDTVARMVVYALIALTSTAAVAIAAHRNLEGANRAPWYLFAAGLAFFTAGDIIFDYYTLAGRDLPLPSPADGVYLAGYACLFIAIALLVGRYREIRGTFVLVETLIVICVFAFVQWATLVEPLVGRRALLARALDVAYPVMDVAMLMTLARLSFARAAQTRALVLLIAAIIPLFIADELYYGAEKSSGWYDALWLGSYVVWALAALDPSTRILTRGQIAMKTRLRAARVIGLALLLASMPALLLVLITVGKDKDRDEYEVAGAVVIVLVLIRIAGLALAAGQQSKRLRELDRVRDEFVSSVSHELRTPLTSILGYVELLRDDQPGLSDPQLAHVNVIERSAERLLHMVNNLLTETSIQAGALGHHFAHVDLGVLAAQGVEMALPMAAARQLDFGFTPDGPAPVRGDAKMLGQVVDNLISNAIKFTPPGGRVAVRTGLSHGAVFFEVEDSGVGVAEDEREQLFDLFYRSPSAVAGGVQGTGLGLHIVKSIADAHNGEVTVDSTVGVGSTFRLLLPQA